MSSKLVDTKCSKINKNIFEDKHSPLKTLNHKMDITDRNCFVLLYFWRYRTSYCSEYRKLLFKWIYMVKWKFFEDFLIRYTFWLLITNLHLRALHLHYATHLLCYGRIFGVDDFLRLIISLTMAGGRIWDVP